MTRRVVITGLGVISSIGIGWQDFWKNLLAGESGINPVSSFDTSDHFTCNGGEAHNFRPEKYLSAKEIRMMNRATQMGLVASRMAVKDSGLSEEDLKRKETGISFGTNLGAVQAVEIIDELMLSKKMIPGRELLS